MSDITSNPHIAIACGGTGGHLFPGIAVGQELINRDCSVTLLISPKEVDQQAVKSATDMEVVTLPAVGLTGGNFLRFLGGFWKSYRAAKRVFRARRPDVVLGMGGFTSAPPVLAGTFLGAKTFVHESNSIPGRANRWLAHFVDEGFVYFKSASGYLNLQKIKVSGMPVRSQFLEPVEAASARMALGLDPNKPVLLVMGGSQGASGINDLVVKALPALTQKLPNLQFIHLTGDKDLPDVRAAYANSKVRAVVRAFLTEMEFALGAATVAVSRSGASSLAEIAAMRVPCVFVPYPHAADNHQYFNALEFVGTGAGRTIQQANASPETFAAEVIELVTNEAMRGEIQQALAKWHTPDAANRVAEEILNHLKSNASAQTGSNNPRSDEAARYGIRKEAGC